MMARAQVSLTPEQHRRAKDRAAALGISLGEYVRRLVTTDLGQERRAGDVRALFDLGDSGGSDVHRYKSRYIGESVDRER